ncbi:fumarylacetoacetase [Acinetobacter radioresistens]|uniref:fumarylacetoacetase n=1 Tax=Acinetobacter radioresistens TaxID=40216 RepID=UPI000C338FBC|nr:fumarylacetoacetase [Acinetobacter radioresistens]MCM1936027.1 fumarylacetoacetase [Acinetobacter radioresistens]MCM1953750.1 fumarylacetoacetase [Acinetobacter radioresistens]MCU4308353.1 fumarylacetoacetase [Acinetobacter radioresistens]MCU4568520.1 fumarylacetoacetase [Acinetobacter radioresistens]PKH31622.1 fumarylacetoacetase [Acinetobacter radioresistens]
MTTQLKSFIDVAPDSDFPIQNLPYGIFSETADGKRRAGVALGEYVVDLAVLEQAGLLTIEAGRNYFDQSTLNQFIESGRDQWTQVRSTLQLLLSSTNPELRDNSELREKAFFKRSEVVLHLPVHIPGYTDFYSSKEHATNVGCMFRDPKNALLPNWSELPVGYNGRASSVVVSGTDIVRPSGQVKLPSEERPVFTACRKLDFELETGFIIGKPNQLGEPISIENAWDHIFGMVLFNDWSARDIQQWEYVPLGPFNAKTFASSISPWIVTLDALQPFKTNSPEQEPRPLAYLREDNSANSYDIQLSVELQAAGQVQADVICQTNFKYMYWSMAQQLTHHTISGCNVQVGDLMGSGTISGPTPDSYGSLLELTWNTTKPLTLSNGEQRSFLQDGDTLIMKGYCEKDGLRIGFGEVSGKVLPAVQFGFSTDESEVEQREAV